MTIRTVYCLPVDVLRKFDPTLTRSDLKSDKLFGASDLEKMRSEIEDACGEFDGLTNNPQRLTHMGRGGTDSYEYHDADLRKYQGGVKVFLEHRNVMPFDYSEGDRIQIRTTRENWRDITENEARWRLNAPQGKLNIFTRRVSIMGRNRRAMIDDNIRVKYRYGALGGSRERPGQTTLAANATATDSSLSVESTERLPRSGTVLIGDEPGGNGSPPEYIRYSGVDDANDELQNVTRGLRGTPENSHSAGDTVHYCRMSLRKAVAGRVAIEFVRSDDLAGNLPTPDDNVGHGDKIEAWNEDWERALQRYSEARLL